MRITKIEIEGREDRYATISRRRRGRWIEVTILTPYQPDGQIHRIAANADGDEFRRQARNLQTTIDGRRWCMQKDLLRLLLQRSVQPAKMCGVKGNRAAGRPRGRQRRTRRRA